MASTRDVMVAEFKRARDVTLSILKGETVEMGKRGNV